MMAWIGLFLVPLLIVPAIVFWLIVAFHKEEDDND